MDYGIDVVNTIEELRALDDSGAQHNRPCLVDDPTLGWFLIDRTAGGEDDGKSNIMPSSGKGRWVIMTPQTMGIVAGAKNAAAELGHPRFQEAEPEPA